MTIPTQSPPPGEAETARLSDEELDHLLWMTTNPAAVVTMSKSTLRVLVEAYAELRVIGSLEQVTGGRG